MIGTQVVSFMKARKIAQDELNKSLAEQTTQLATDEQALRKLEDAIKSGAKYEDVFDDAMQGASKSAKEHAIATKGAAGSTDVFVEKQKQAQTQLQATTKASKAASVAMKALSIVGNMFLGMAISWGVSKIFEGIDSLYDTEKELEEMRQEIKATAETAKSEFDSIKSEMESTASTVDEVSDRYAELAQGVRNLGKANQSQGKLSNDEYAEFLDLSNQLADLFPRLTQGYDDNGNAILKLSGDIDTITDSLNNFVSAEQAIASRELQEKLPEIWEGYSLEIKEANKTISDFQTNREELSSTYNALIDALNSEENIHHLFGMDDNISTLLSGSDYSIEDFKGYFDYEGSDGITRTLEGYNFINLDDTEVEDLKAIIEDNYAQITETYIEEINNASHTIENANKNFANYFYSSLEGDVSYEELKDEYKNILNGLVFNYDFNEDDLSIFSGVYITKLKNDLINQFSSLTEDEDKESLFQEYYNKLLQIDTDASLSENLPKIQEYISKLAELLGVEASQLQIALGYDISGGYEDINDARNKLGYIEGNPNQLSDSQKERNKQIEEFTNLLNEDDLELWNGAKIPERILDGNIKDWEAHLEELKEIAEENPLITHVELQTSADSMKSAMSDLQTALSDYQENGLEGMDISNLTKLNNENTFGNINGSTAAYEKFLSVMHNVDATAEEVQKAFNELASAYIYNSELADDITEDTKEWTAIQLEQSGVINANAVAEQMLINKYGAEKIAISECINANLSLNGTKLDSKNATEELEEATASETLQLAAEADNANMASEALLSYAIDKELANKSAITTDGDIKNLIALCEGLEGAIELIEQYKEVKDNIAKMEQTGAPPSAITSAEQSADTILGQIKLLAELGNNANTTSSGIGSGGSSSSKEDVNEVIDWIEVAITRKEEAISRLDKVVSNTYTNWINRNISLVAEMSKVEEEIALQQKGYDAYIAKANSIGLSDTYKKKVQNGTIQIEDITDATLREQINQYTEWYEKAIACSDAIQDLKINLSELAEQKFDNLQTEYDNIISVITATADIIDERINRTEEQGYFVNKNYYAELMAYEQNVLNNLKTEYDAMKKSFTEAVNSGAIEEGSEAWSSMKEELLGVQNSIEESTTAIVEFNNAIRDLDWEIFDYIQERITGITEESEFLIDLLDNQNIYNDDGSFNERGESVNALHGINYNTYMQQALDYAKELQEIEKQIANDPNSKDLIERREELLELQRESISNAEAEKDAIQSLVQEGINIHLESLTELIDKYKESLNAAKDLYEYQKNISEQTEEIANLEKILMAYQGDDSEETKKLIQDYTNQLNEAKDNLQETEWDRYISETGNLLDDLYADYEETLNARLDNIDLLISDMIDSANSNASSIRETITEVSKNVGYDLTANFNNLLSSNNPLLSNFTTNFINSSTAIQSILETIKNAVLDMSVNANTSIDDVESGTRNGWVKNANGSWSHYQKGTQTKNAWIKDNNDWYHLNSNGIMDSNKWIYNSSGNWSYVGANGAATTGWQYLDWNGSSDWYNFDSNGVMKEDTWIGDYFVGKDGKMKTNTWIGHNGKYYWVGNDGKWLNISGWTLNSKPSDGLPIYEYAKGSKYINKNQLAWTQENGSELIYRASDGAILTPLSTGDMVFTHKMSENLWKLAKGNMPNIVNDYKLPNITPNNVKSVNNQNTISITLPNVTNYDEFKAGLQKDPKFIGFIQESTIGEMMGRNSLNRNMY